MAHKTLTDASYELVGRLEGQKSWKLLIITVAVALASFGLVMNAFGFILFSHQKSGIFDLNMVIVAANIILCSVFLLIGTNYYRLLKRYRRSIGELEMLEETIYKEVLE